MCHFIFLLFPLFTIFQNSCKHAKIEGIFFMCTVSFKRVRPSPLTWEKQWIELVPASSALKRMTALLCEKTAGFTQMTRQQIPRPIMKSRPWLLAGPQVFCLVFPYSHHHSHRCASVPAKMRVKPCSPILVLNFSMYHETCFWSWHHNAQCESLQAPCTLQLSLLLLFVCGKANFSSKIANLFLLTKTLTLRRSAA